jgi:hypothetical protein
MTPLIIFIMGALWGMIIYNSVILELKKYLKIENRLVRLKKKIEKLKRKERKYENKCVLKIKSQ